MELKFATYNIAHSEYYKKYLEGTIEINWKNIAQFIMDHDLDICALNEVDWNCKRSGYIHEAYLIAQYLTEQTGTTYYWAFAAGLVNRLGPGSQYGNAIISRYPIKGSRSVPVDVGVGMAEGHEPRTILVADFEIEDKPLTVICTHFGLKHDEKVLMMEKVREELAQASAPVIFLGDFNVQPMSEYYPWLTEVLRDACEDKTSPLTFPANEPRAKIDYIFTSHDLKPYDVKVDPVLYSDHLPLLAKLDW